MILYILFINSFLAAFSSMRHKYLNKIIGRRKNHGQRGVEHYFLFDQKLTWACLAWSTRTKVVKRSARLTH